MTDRVTVVESGSYLSKAEKIMSASEREAVVDAISINPLAGVLIKGAGGLRKMRFGLEGRGKRGGSRVVYWFHSGRFPAVLLWAFAKNEAADLNPAQLARIARIADSLKAELGGTQ
jgi:hypothetical protein